ncbi:MAG TPA: hypothetical protein VF550_03165 [Polyangia bacterium]
MCAASFVLLSVLVQVLPPADLQANAMAQGQLTEGSWGRLDFLA